MGRMIREGTFRAWKAAELILRNMNPGILGIQEGPSLKCLEEFLAGVGLSEMYRYAVVVKGNDSYHDVGWISKYPIKEVCTHRDARFSPSKDRNLQMYLGRDCLEAVIQVTPNFKMTTFGIHLARNPIINQAESVYVREVVEKTEGAVALLGDFNAFPGSRAFNRLKNMAGFQASNNFVREPELFMRRPDYILFKNLEIVPDSLKLWKTVGFLKQEGLKWGEDFDPHHPVSIDIKIPLLSGGNGHLGANGRSLNGS